MIATAVLIKPAARCQCLALIHRVDNLTARLRESQHQLAELDRRYRVLAAQRAGATEIQLASGAVLDLARCEVRRDGGAVVLARGQWRLVELLTLSGRQSLAELKRYFYGSDDQDAGHALHLLIFRTRRRLARIGADGDLIACGGGYLLAVAR